MLPPVRRTVASCVPHGHVQVLSPALQEHTGVEGSELMLAQHQKLEEQLQELLCTPVWNPNDALLHRYMMVGAALQRHSLRGSPMPVHP